MRANTPGFVGERLVEARKGLRLSGVGLADLLDVSPTTITQYEKGKQSPRPEIMDRICEKLGFPRAFFLKPVSDHGERKIYYRSLSAAAKSARERAEVRFGWLREMVEYLHEYFDFPHVNLPPLSLPTDFRDLSHATIEGAAQACRELWGFGDGPVTDLVLAMESNGIIVARDTLDSDALDAFSEYLDDGLPFVVLGTDKGVHARSRFDAAHELGHLILHKGVSRRDIGQPKDFKLLEQQAHRFAASFLLPRSAFLRSIWAPTLDAFRGQKETWGVSIKGMIVRSHQIGLLSDEQYQRMLINYGRRYRDGEPGDDSKPVEAPRLLARCFRTLEEERVRSKEQVLLDLSIPAAVMEELAGLPRRYFAGSADLIQLPTLKRTQPSPPASSGDDDGSGGSVVRVCFRKNG